MYRYITACNSAKKKNKQTTKPHRQTIWDTTLKWEMKGTHGYTEHSVLLHCTSLMPAEPQG